MDTDEHVCLCFKVSLRKLVHYMERECPQVPSQLSECLGAGTGCQWCVPTLEKLHCTWAQGNTPAIPEPHAVYVEHRAAYRQARRESAAAAAAEAARRAAAEPAPGGVAPGNTAQGPTSPENDARS